MVFYLYLDKDELVVLRQGVESGQALGELHHLLHGGGHAQRDVVPQQRAHVRGAVRGGRGRLLSTTPYDVQKLKKSAAYPDVQNILYNSKLANIN